MASKHEVHSQTFAEAGFFNSRGREPAGQIERLGMAISQDGQRFRPCLTRKDRTTTNKGTPYSASPEIRFDE